MIQTRKMKRRIRRVMPAAEVERKGPRAPRGCVTTRCSSA